MESAEAVVGAPNCNVCSTVPRFIEVTTTSWLDPPFVVMEKLLFVPALHAPKVRFWVDAVMDGPNVIVLCSVGPGDAESVNSPAFRNLPLFSKDVLVSTT